MSWIDDERVKNAGPSRREERQSYYKNRTARMDDCVFLARARWTRKINEESDRAKDQIEPGFAWYSQKEIQDLAKKNNWPFIPDPMLSLENYDPLRLHKWLAEEQAQGRHLPNKHLGTGPASGMGNGAKR